MPDLQVHDKDMKVGTVKQTCCICGKGKKVLGGRYVHTLAVSFICSECLPEVQEAVEAS